MATLEKQIADIRSKADSDIKAITEFAALKETVTKVLDLAPANWKPGAKHTAYADCFVEYEVESLNDALVMAERANTLPVVIYKDSCTSLKPECKLKPKEIERAENDGNLCDRIAPYIYRVELAGGLPVKTLVFWQQVESYVVESRVVVKTDKLTHIETVEAKHDHRGRVIQEKTTRCVNSTGHFSHVIKWYSSDIKYSTFTLYSY